MSNNDSKRLVASFLQFLKDELNEPGVSADQVESIDVACQCLHMAFATTAQDVPAQQEKLKDIFLDKCPAPAQRPPLSVEALVQADTFKQQGNAHMKSENYSEAITCYNKAIEIDPNNAVFYCNRAAAYTGLEKFDLSITDCKKSLEIDPKYSKAHSRMGLTFSKMEIYDEAIDCYKRALDMDPGNEGYQKNLQIAEEKLKVKPNTPSSGGGSGLPGMDGGMGGFLNNPMFMNMAEQMMQNPAMQQMAMNMMSGMMGGGGQTGAAQTPDMSQILQMGQQFAQQLSTSNPQLVEQLREQLPHDDGDKSDKDTS